VETTLVRTAVPFKVQQAMVRQTHFITQPLIVTGSALSLLSDKLVLTVAWQPPNFSLSYSLTVCSCPFALLNLTLSPLLLLKLCPLLLFALSTLLLISLRTLLLLLLTLNALLLISLNALLLVPLLTLNALLLISLNALLLLLLR
jgi:hypothetical protein